DDCLPAPGWLKALKEHCVALPDHIVGGRILNALQDNPFAATSQLLLEVVYSHYNRAGAGQARFFASNNMAMAAEHFRAIGGFDRTFITSEDRELCDRWLHMGNRLTYAPEAVVYHAHALTLGSLWRQHFGYGRGAWRFHHLRKQSGRGPLRIDWEFYRRLAISPLAQGDAKYRLALASLMMVAQTANCAGFLYEGARPAGNRQL
ncbi:MAG TPA: glycosyltransferase, partial [Candidatus Binataceae bacterium]|nr:glycosyltransferase [Candidatus Binataceae bacterium]